MALQVSLVILPLAVLVAVVIDVSSADRVDVQKKKYFTPEAGKMAYRLNTFMLDLGNRYQEFGKNLIQDNELMTVLKKYRTTYEKAKETECAGEEPPKMDDEDLMKSYLGKCEGLTSAPLTAFYKKMDAANDKLEEIDYALKQNAATCVTDPTGCEITEEIKQNELENILSDDEAFIFQDQVDNAVADCAEQVKKCFLSDIKELHDQLEEGIKKTEECLANHK